MPSSARRTNVGLLVLLPVAFVSGWAAFGIGTAVAGTLVVVAHGLAGIGVLVLAPWKSVIVRRGMRRERSGRWVSLLLAALAAAVVASGLAHAGGFTGPVLGIATMQVHVGAAIAAMPLAAWHVVARPSRPRRADLSRRSLLRAGGVLGATALAWAGAEGLWAVTGAPGARRRFTGSHRSDPRVTQWLFDTVPRTDPAAWRLRLGDRTLRLDDLPAGEPVRAVLDCTGGWYAEQEFHGVRLDRLVGGAGAAAASVVVRSVTGYTRRFPVADLDRLWLATAADGRPLSPGHGAPARLVAPGRRGFWWVKWVDSIQLSDLPAWRQPPFPLQ